MSEKRCLCHLSEGITKCPFCQSLETYNDLLGSDYPVKINGICSFCNEENCNCEEDYLTTIEDLDREKFSEEKRKASPIFYDPEDTDNDILDDDD